MKTGMKLIQGALFVLLFLFAACTPHRRPIPDEMIGEHRIHRADGLMTQDYRLSISPVNDSVYDIKLWERKSSSESPEKGILRWIAFPLSGYGAYLHKARHEWYRNLSGE